MMGDFRSLVSIVRKAFRDIKEAHEYSDYR